MRKTGSGHLAADIMQETFTRYLERYADRESVSLLFTISRNLLHDLARTARNDTPYDEERHGAQQDQEHLYQVREESRRVLAAMERLDEEERDILSLVVSSGMSYREIGALTGNSEANIKVKVHRARCKLKKILQTNEP